MASSGQPKFLIADPNGDVKFIIGDPNSAKTLRVSSKVLSLASPVFAALFSLKSSEGVALRNSTNVSEISLPDDDPEAMQLVCHILHHGHDITRKVSVALLEKVATLCDKHDTVTPLSAWSEVWLHAWKSILTEEDDWMKMMHISYVFGNSGAFFLSTTELFFSCPMISPSPPAEDVYGLSKISDRLLGESQQCSRSIQCAPSEC